ncbi:putative transcriptional regulator [Janibacter sp. HTCC2649]|uniref:BTAD domain-containing putative transcriptional regulator n=1 Tax=Janibacter sp. HTCC2649 TaxID=313589 RepID=UPI0000670867|nr:BTAD domain-containing putative transcriptional regulator [Janibacter sp. HTCC2649]EAQ00227.1 putative transcriptional regulator [Janibacter sp. HTCC2649]
MARRGRPVPTETLLDLVWGDDSLGLTPTAVHTAVARLRRQTEADLVRTTDLGYAISHDVECDADVFSELVADTNALDAALRVDRLRAALALWSGPSAYAGVSDRLVLAERARLDDLRDRAIAHLSGALLELGGAPEGREAHDLARALVNANPLDESAAALAMRAAYRSEGQAEALQIHEDLRRALRDELGVRPGAQVRDLHARVLAQDPSLEAAHQRSTPASPLTSLHPGRLVPIPPSPTIGRQDDVATVLDALASGRRLVTVTGPGGVGKSRLLAEVGAALAGSREVAHIALGGHAALPVDELAASVALAAGLPLVDDDPVAGLVAALRTSTVTILADEAEWVLESAAALASALLAGAPGVTIVVTSRAPLSVVGERIVVLEPLATADPRGPMEEIRAAAAVRLLVERLADRGDLSADVQEIADGELRVVAEVAHRLDGLPLALEIVAGAAAGGPLLDLPEVAAAALDVEVEDHGRDERHRSLREALTWGVGRLGPEARVVLRRLGVFAGPFTTAAAAAVVGEGAGQVDRAVRELARHNLLKVERAPTTLSFRMLRVVRDLARDELTVAGEVEATRQRHRRWFAGAWRDSALCDELVEHVGRTHDDHVEALTDALAHHDDVAAGDIALALCRRWQFVEASAVGTRWATRVLDRRGLTDRQRARLEICRAGFLQGADWDAAHHEELRDALEGDPEWSALLDLTGAITTYALGDVPGARRHLDLARTAAASLHSLLPEIIATRAVVDAAAGDVDAALAGAREAIARVGITRSAVHSVTVVPKVALALLDAGKPREALELLTTAAADTEARFGIRPTSTTAINAGWAALAIDDGVSALCWFRESLTGPQAATAAPTVAEAAMGAGSALAALGHVTAAEVLGLGRLLLAASQQELPPTLEALTARAEEAAGVLTSNPDWDVVLASNRVVQLLDNAVAPATPRRA